MELKMKTCSRPEHARTILIKLLANKTINQITNINQNYTFSYTFVFIYYIGEDRGRGLLQSIFEYRCYKIEKKCSQRVFVHS